MIFRRTLEEKKVLKLHETSIKDKKITKGWILLPATFAVILHYWDKVNRYLPLLYILCIVVVSNNGRKSTYTNSINYNEVFEEMQ